MAAIHKRLVFSAASSARQLQQFIELNVFHRQGFVYGAKEGKKFHLFVDDMNLPKSDSDGVQRVNEVTICLHSNILLCFNMLIMFRKAELFSTAYRISYDIWSYQYLPHSY